MRHVLLGTINLLLILNNKPKRIQNSCIIEIGLSDFQKLILTLFRTWITCLEPKIFPYCNYKYLDLNGTEFLFKTVEPNKNYNFITEKFLDGVKRHATLKKKTLRGNQAPFMTKNNKEINIH